jgi:hypothetical protein
MGRMELHPERSVLKVCAGRTSTVPAILASSLFGLAVIVATAAPAFAVREATWSVEGEPPEPELAILAHAI